MKILLIAVNAKYIHSNLAVYSLKAYAEKYQNQIEIAEFTINQYVDDCLREIYKKKPDILAFSCYIWNSVFIRELAAEVKKVMPDSKIWLGGPEVSFDSRQTLEKLLFADGIMRGEGEETFTQLLKFYLDKEGSLADISGLTYREDKKIKETGDRPVLDLNKIPFPYPNHLEKFENKIIYYESSRGCPYSCSYCLSSIDKRLRLRNIDIVKEELQFFLDAKVKQVKFVDRTFNCVKKHAEDIWSFIKEKDNGVTNFHFEIAAHIISDEEIELLSSMRPGLIQLEIGVQSANLETIRAIHRHTDMQRLEHVVERIREGRNIHQHLDLIAGLPYEGYESFTNSFNQVYQLKPDQLQLGFLKVLKGTVMEQQKEANQLVYKDTPPYEVLFTKWLSYKEVIILKQVEEMTEIYYNSGQFVYSISYLLHYHETPFDFFKSLGDYYEEKEYNKQNHARLARYEILLNYYKEKILKAGESSQPFCEILIFDCYLRENLKSRPAFAEDNHSFSQFYHDFYKSAEAASRYLKAYEGYNARQKAKMTHIEHFNYDVEVMAETGQAIKKDYFILFDYLNRDVLTYEASTAEIARRG